MDMQLMDGSKQTIEVSEEVFNAPLNEALIHQLVVAYQANARAGNRAQKGRSAISKSTRKPWKQKGTGRARAGMASSPLWRGGGKIFPNSPDENFTQKVNRKMYRAGIRSILSQLNKEGRLQFLSELKIEQPKTKLFLSKLKELGVTRALIIADTVDENIYLAARNLPHVQIIEPHQVDPVSLLHFDRTIITQGAIQKLQEILA